MNEITEIIDHQERLDAIDPQRSFIVQAPAGSGKTELLIQRMLSLLGHVSQPQQILAITFTRKAAAEMRTRLLAALDSAQGDRPVEPHKQKTWDLASLALKRDHELGWNILENPNLLMIQTIDSLNASLVRKMPWLSRFGGLPEVSTDPESLYLQAAENLMTRLDSDLPGSKQLARLLAHIDNRVDRFQELLLSLLKRRDQWLRHLIGINKGDPQEILESGLIRLVEGCLMELADELPESLQQDLLFCGRSAAANLSDKVDRPLLALTDLTDFPGNGVEHLPAWKGFSDLLLTGKDEIRKPRGINKTCGFPTDAAGKDAKEKMQNLVEILGGNNAFLRLIIRCRQLPNAYYSADQWAILKALVELLPLLVVELWKVFRAESQTDFSEIALKALFSLGSAEDPTDLLLKIDNSIEHCLVDEFQDTNRLQYHLLQTLTAGWQEGDGRTLFLVGDPMQSIYRFREAEVGLFMRAFGGNFGENGLFLEPVQLHTNFRSQKGIVDWVNTTFATIFPPVIDEATGAVPLTKANANIPNLPDPACQVQIFVGRNDTAEAEAVVDHIEKLKDQDAKQSIAVLVRSRTHIPEILRVLRHRGISYQAQDIDLLGAQPVSLDIISLTRALLHRADRLSWLALLRAPWIALSLGDLHALVDGAAKETIPSLLQNKKRWENLSAEGQQRLSRAWPILEASLRRRGRIALRSLVEGCWLALGGPACYDLDAVENAQMVFELIESSQEGGELADIDLLNARLEKLFATTDSLADGTLQILTVHKSKGLEWDHVILPGLGRIPRREDSPLLRWLEHPEFGLLLAPIAPRDGSDQDPIYRFIGKLEEEKQQHETGRLLYVAATRAKKSIHLFGHVSESSKGERKPDKGSLLEILWPVIGEEAGPLATVPVEVDLKRFLPLRRLPLGWEKPELVAASLPINRAPDVSNKRSNQTMQGTAWVNQNNINIGTIIHRILEQIGKFGPASWKDKTEDQKRLEIARQLGVLGVMASDHEVATKKVLLAIDMTLNGLKGNWVLESHEGAESEYALSGVVGNQLVHTVIDRTFIDDGVRWIIDYKTGEPQDGESVETFLTRETENHRAQIETYRDLFIARDSDREVRSALYFPMIDAWCEITAAKPAISEHMVKSKNNFNSKQKENNYVG